MIQLPIYTEADPAKYVEHRVDRRVTYRSAAAFQSDAAERIAQGWVLLNVTNEPRRIVATWRFVYAITALKEAP